MRAVQAGAGSDLIADLMGFASPQQVVQRYRKPELDQREQNIMLLCHIS